MFRPRVIPILLLKNKGLVKTVQFKNSRYIGDPINAVRIFNDLETDELVFLDITASKEGRTISENLVKKIGDEAFMPFAVGGGVKSVSDIKILLNCGAEKVVINSESVENPGLIKRAAMQFGSQSVIVSIDVKKGHTGKYLIYTFGGRKKVRISPVQHAREMEKLGAGEIIINSISHDGMMEGYDTGLIKKVADAVRIPVIACGGAGNLGHLRNACFYGNASAVAAGSLFIYHGPRHAVLVNYPEKENLMNIFN